MPCLTVETTNGLLEKVRLQLEELIEYAEADAQHARENDALTTARDDMTRARKLREALRQVEGCKR